MYSWNNNKKLNILKVAGAKDILKFEAGKEKALVYLQGEDISKVIYSLSGKEYIIKKSQCKHFFVGTGNFKRHVYHYLFPNGPAPTMRLGITKHSGLGTWSSLPHDFELSLERGFEEVFFYLIRGETKKAIQVGRGVWYNNKAVDSIWSVADHTFSVIPMGYHPVVAEPKVHVSYIWIYLARKKQWEKI